MSISTYEGWRVPSNIIIVAKDCRVWKNGKYVADGTPQGYVVEPNNKSMLESALNWAKWTEYQGEYNKETRRYEKQIEHVGKVYEFVNEGFTLAILDSANGSSQGGQLSFWNCLISKDDKEFVIGIASDYLLEILLHNDFKNGVCQSTLSFARCKGGVGMMNKAMPSYQQFLQDEQHRVAMKKGKTKKREPGHLYSTLTGGNVYFTTFYIWYEPVYRDAARRWSADLIGFKKLDKPLVRYWQPTYDKEFTKKSEYISGYFWLDDNTPARTDSGIVAEIDISDEELFEKIINRFFPAEGSSTYFVNYVGIGLSNTEYTMPEAMHKFITDRGYKVWG